MRIEAPAPQTVTVIDYDITLSCGRDFSFTLRPDLGDSEQFTDQHITLRLAVSNHVVELRRDQLAINSRRERQMVLPQPKAPKTNERRDTNTA